MARSQLSEPVEHSVNDDQNLYDPTEFQDRHADPRKDNEFIIASFNDTEQDPGATYGDIIRTGSASNTFMMAIGHRAMEDHASNLAGSERHAGNYAHEFLHGHQEIGPIRAMCFANDLAASHREAVDDVLSELHRLTVSPEPNLTESPLAEFVANRPDSWVRDGREIINYASDVINAGQLLAYRGISESDPDKIAAGRILMQAASFAVEDAVSQPDNISEWRTAIPELTFRTPGAFEFTNEHADDRITYLNTVDKAIAPLVDDPEHHASARRAVADSIVHRDLQNIYQQGSYRMAYQPAHPLISPTLQHLNFSAFLMENDPSAEHVRRELAASNPEDFDSVAEARYCYRQMHQVHDALMAVNQAASNPQHEAFREALSDVRAIMEHYDTSREAMADHHDVVELLESIRDRTDPHTQHIEVATHHIAEPGARILASQLLASARGNLDHAISSVMAFPDAGWNEPDEDDEFQKEHAELIQQALVAMHVAQPDSIRRILNSYQTASSS